MTDIAQNTVNLGEIRKFRILDPSSKAKKQFANLVDAAAQTVLQQAETLLAELAGTVR